MIKRLIFVYNANSGVFNAAADLAHKLLSPSTYACRLCALTYSPLGIRWGWREFLDDLPPEKEFLHRNEWQDRHRERDDVLPAVFAMVERAGQDDELVPLLGAARLNAAGSLEELQELLRSALADHGE